MILKVCASGSSGNSYALISGDGEILMIECGVSWNRMINMINYNVSKVVGCIASHAHSDHIQSYKDCLFRGISIYTNDETAEHFEIISGEKMIGKPEKIPFKLSEYTIIPFYVPHATRDKETGALIPCPNFGYLISHEEMGTLLYMTDYEYCRYRFKNQNITHMLIECNHLDELMDSGAANYAHVLKGHASLEVCKDFISANKTPALRNVILCHLSSENADPDRMKREVQEVVGKWVMVDVAEKNSVIPLNKYPF